MATSPIDLSSFRNSKEKLTITKINKELIPAMRSRISKAQESFPKFQASNGTDDGNNSHTGVDRRAAENDGNSTGDSIPIRNVETAEQAREKEKLARLNGHLERLKGYLNYIEVSFVELEELVEAIKRKRKDSEEVVNDPMKLVMYRLDELLKEITTAPLDSAKNKKVDAKLQALNEIIVKLKPQVPSAHKIGVASSDSSKSDSTVNSSTILRDMSDGLQLPQLHVNQQFAQDEVFKTYKVLYQSLDPLSKLCLLCFSVFSEDEEVKQRFLLYWWIGEGFINPVPGNSEETTAEGIADEILEKLQSKGFIEPVNKKHTIWAAKSFKMHPLIRSVVIKLSKEAGFIEFDNFDGNPTTHFCFSHKAFLSKEGSSYNLSRTLTPQPSGEDSTTHGHQTDSVQNPPNPDCKCPQPDPEKLYTLFNVKESYLKFDPDWFPKVKNVKVIQLGRWQSSGLHHIEVEDTDYFKRFTTMNYLKFLSLQGISRITELPGSMFTKFPSLTILDLRACHNLETLPDEVCSLKTLIILDLSECYLLNEIPKGIGSLSDLQVLKGFVIADNNSKTASTVADLVKLKNLRKLSIRAGREDFPGKNEVDAMGKLSSLLSLSITWGGAHLRDPKAKQGMKRSFTKRMSTLRSITLNRKNNDIDITYPQLPEGLKKLDLQCFPVEKKPQWLNPVKLKNLEKLYIRGGNLSSLGDRGTTTWRSVEKLYLKHVWRVKMDWNEFNLMFPKVVYLEKVGCPGLVFFPCNEDGAWQRIDEHH